MTDLDNVIDTFRGMGLTFAQGTGISKVFNQPDVYYLSLSMTTADGNVVTFLFLETGKFWNIKTGHISTP